MKLTAHLALLLLFAASTVGCDRGTVFIEYRINGMRVEATDIDCTRVLWQSGDSYQRINGPILTGADITAGLTLISGMPFNVPGDYLAQVVVSGDPYCGFVEDIRVRDAPNPLPIEIDDNAAMVMMCDDYVELFLPGEPGALMCP